MHAHLALMLMVSLVSTYVLMNTHESMGWIRLQYYLIDDHMFSLIFAMLNVRLRWSVSYQGCFFMIEGSRFTEYHNGIRSGCFLVFCLEASSFLVSPLESLHL